MAETYRLFIAVDVAVTDGLRRVIRELGEMGGAVKPVRPDNLHATLKFLGDTDPELVPLLQDNLQAAVGGIARFETQLVGLGAFPHARRPSVVWAGMQGAEALIQMAERLEQPLQSLGFAPEKRTFQPHLTLARIRRKPPDALFRLLETEQATDFGSATIEQVHLYRSQLGSDGARYTVLAAAKLAEPEHG